METHKSVSASGEWGIGIIDIGPELVLAIQKKYTEAELQSVYLK